MTTEAGIEPKKEQASNHDLEVKDANLIFNAVWNELVDEFGEDNLRFPREIIWLNGAPGSGKGTNTDFIMELRDITTPPVVVSDLLNSPEARAKKEAGILVGDKEVLGLLFKELLKPDYHLGTIVDGFPRSFVQVQCLKTFYAKLNEQRSRHLGSSKESLYPKPQFHIVVLFVDEKEAVKRQISRGQKAIEHNEKVRASGEGELIEIRSTDTDEAMAQKRYRVFKEQTFEPLKELRSLFHYHFINAQGAIPEVQQRIVDELKYQSSLELDPKTFDRVSQIPTVEKIVKHARQELVNRLDDYELNHTALFRRVVEVIQEKFIPIVERHAISGRAYISSEDPVFNDRLALQMLIDVFSERGFSAAIDIRKEDLPERFDLKTGEIFTRTKRVYRVRVNFCGSEIRRGL
ncbi:MAG: nucleoside monophosphate kinase [Opitutales bacterium]|nr:nucleoside monophosphate kinase [Opitutales bacterium]NRA26810.1 nucleoside monophosphate kinase [Opitutales bacterium]